MKILLANTLYAPNLIGGAEKSVQHLAESLSVRGHEVLVVSLSANGLNEESTLNGVHRTFVRTPNLYYPFNQPWYGKITKPYWHFLDSYNRKTELLFDFLIGCRRPDVVHTNNLLGFSTSIWNAAKKYNIPVVHTVRDYYLLCPRSTMFKNGSRCSTVCKSCKPFARRKCANIHNVNALIGVSKKIVQLHAESMSELPEICDHVYNGIDLSRKFEFQRKKSSGGIRLGFLGRISPEKGLEFLLLALKKLTIPVRLLVGGGIDSATAKKMRSIASNVNIDFMGYVKPETIFQEVDYLVVPSLWNEPFSRVIIEAYAYGVPVVASDRGGIGEIVRDGETGYIFDPESIDSAVSAIWKAFKALGNWQDLSKNSSEYSKQFDLNVATGSYLKIYDEVIGRRRRLHSPGSLVTP